MNNEIVKYRYASFWKEEDDDVVYFTYSQNLEMDIVSARQIVRDRLEFCRQKPMYSLIDLSNLKSVTKEAREYMSDPRGGLKGVLGGAFVSDKILTTVIVNLFLKINRPAVPAKFFTRKEDALNWLQKIKLEKSEKVIL